MSASVVIAGGGLAGALLAVLLSRAGHRVEVYERRADMRRDTSAAAGKSINLALSVRGIHALEQAGVLDEIMRIAIPMYGRMVHPLSGEPSFLPYSPDPSVGINSVSRSELNKLLLTLAEKHGSRFYFDHRCAGVNFNEHTATFVDETTKKSTTVSTERLIGSDGAFSAVRGAMQRLPYFDYSQAYLTHAYKELSIPPAESGGFQINKNALHIWPRGDFMMIALPNIDGSFTCTLFLRVKGDKDSFEALQTLDQVKDFFDRTFPDAVPLMPTLLQDWQTNPTSPLVTVRCGPWAKGGVALLGDAAHAVVPFFGQGMNCAFEDCSELIDCLGKYPDWATALSHYGENRKPNADAIATMALENFVEMREKVADPYFLLCKELEHAISSKMPRYQSRYELVSFTRTPYAEAYKRGEINQKILAELISSGVKSAADLNWTTVEEVVSKYYAESKL
eukprot:TRINITY_DN1958_c0_g1_i1.p1 TRINITY_DN1958_c0_g1~~TRINITY_DN1958_c0_g1_i1.p1  ORF type:complete len:458 (+),score=69.47 TRINITY_DN1958_c0_g1_i1:22-1374(+)